MDLIQESFTRLFPEKEFTYKTKLEYNRRLSSFNANIKMHYNVLSVNMNLQWKDIEDEIKIGLVQSLLLKILKKKKEDTPNIILYNNFIKQIPTLTPKTKTDEVLEASFHRMNERFFLDQLEKPNLQWGTASFRKLACYNFHDDSITVSTLFKEAPKEVLDYLMFHEMLHKHFKFENKNGRSSYHSRAFRRAESEYPHQKEMERQIEGIIRNHRRGSRRKKWWEFM